MTEKMKTNEEDQKAAQYKEEEFEDWEGEERFSVSADAKFESMATETMIVIYSTT